MRLIIWAQRIIFWLLYDDIIIEFEGSYSKTLHKTQFYHDQCQTENVLMKKILDKSWH